MGDLIYSENVFPDLLKAGTTQKITGVLTGVLKGLPRIDLDHPGFCVTHYYLFHRGASLLCVSIHPAAPIDLRRIQLAGKYQSLADLVSEEHLRQKNLRPALPLRVLH
jgi:hypothetical protein